MTIPFLARGAHDTNGPSTMAHEADKVESKPKGAARSAGESGT
jgi:hypothetical protein